MKKIRMILIFSMLVCVAFGSGWRTIYGGSSLNNIDSLYRVIAWDETNDDGGYVTYQNLYAKIYADILISGVIGDTLEVDYLKLENGSYVNEFSTDCTFSGNSNLVVPTEKAILDYINSFKGYAGMINNTDTTEIATAQTLYPVRGTFTNVLFNYYLDADEDMPGIVVDSTLTDSLILDLRLDGHGFVDVATTNVSMGFCITKANGSTMQCNVRPTFCKFASESVPFIFHGFPKVGAKDKITIVVKADKACTFTASDLIASVSRWINAGN